MPYYLYMANSLYTRSHGQSKLGCTMYPSERMHTYNTGDAVGIGLEKTYQGIWEINAKNDAEMKMFESMLHSHCADVRLFRQNGEKTEWFSCQYEKVASYIISQPFYVRTITNDRSNRVFAVSHTIRSMHIYNNKILYKIL